MANITPIKPNLPLAPTASEEVSPALWRRLTNAQLTWAEAVQHLVDDEQARGELARAAPQLRRHIEPCGPKVIAATLGPLLTLYGVADKTEAESKAFWGFYIDALGGLPAEAIRLGVAEYVADAKSEFFPKPGPLKAICERHAVPLRMAANRATKALELASAPAPKRMDPDAAIRAVTAMVSNLTESDQ